VIAFSWLLVGCSQPSAPPQPVPPASTKLAIDNQVDPDLKRAAEQLVLSLESGRPEDFLNLASKEGVCFGIDCDSTPLEQIKKEFHAKKGAYCELYDSVCLRKAVLALWKGRKHHKGEIEEVLGYHDVLNAAVSKDMKIQNDGQVHIRIQYKDASKSVGFGIRPEEMDFGFAKEDGSWKLTGMESY